MVQSAASTVAEYLAELPAERRDALTALRAQVRRALPAGFIETMQYGMINYVVPLSRFANTYNGQPLSVLALASQKQHMALYLSGLYGDAELRTWFEKAYGETGKRLDLGKSCLRFKRLEDLALDVVTEAVRKVGVDDLIAMHDAAHPPKQPRGKATGATAPKRRLQ